MEQLAPRAARAGQATFGQLVYFFGKRIVDIVGGSLLLLVLSPLILTIALVIWLDDGAPIIYRCQRLGRFGQPITVFKFRTMRDGSHHHLQELLSVDEEKRLEYHRKRKLRDDPRRTRVGIFLRRTSLDELAQLINVLVGDMSIVGPRPYLPNELLHRAEGRQILRVRPGITGLWQVNGRSDRTFEERIAFDLEYVRKRGIRQDVSILARTIGAVLSGRGAY